MNIIYLLFLCCFYKLNLFLEPIRLIKIDLLIETHVTSIYKRENPKYSHWIGILELFMEFIQVCSHKTAHNSWNIYYFGNMFSVIDNSSFWKDSYVHHNKFTQTEWNSTQKILYLSKKYKVQKQMWFYQNVLVTNQI